MPLIKAAQNDFPQIVKAVRYDSRGLNIKGGQAETFAEQAYFTDPSFFDLFNLPLIKGSNNLADLSAVLITERTAQEDNKNFLKQPVTFQHALRFIFEVSMIKLLKLVTEKL